MWHAPPQSQIWMTDLAGTLAFFNGSAEGRAASARRLKLLFELATDLAGIQQVQRWVAVMVVAFGFQAGVARRAPEELEKALVMLPSGRLMERWSSGIKVNGSGMALV
jgi:hypothetical protein